MFPFHYFRYKLYNLTPTKTKKQLRDYVPEFYYDRILRPKLNDRFYTQIMRSKILLTKLFIEKPILHPTPLFWSEGDYIVDSQNQLLNKSGFIKILYNCKNDIFLKPECGKGGSGIEVFNCVGQGKFVNQANQAISYEYCLSLGQYIAQQAIQQIDEINEIYSHSINTIRIASRVENGRIVPIAAILRIGQGGNRVDNSAQGGISVEIDIKKWQMSKFGVSEHPVAIYTEHPDTGIKFGQKLPMKDAVFKLMNYVAPVFAKCKLLGWDIALTNDGPVLLEINPGFGIDHIQLTCQRGIARDLGLMKNKDIKK